MQKEVKNTTIKIVIPVENEEGLEAQVASHFGRAPYFSVVELEDGKVKNNSTVPNTGEHFGGQGHPHEKLLSLEPNVVVAQGMGPGGLRSLRDAGVRVLQTDPGKVKDVIAAFQMGNLAELNTGCEHAHHH